MRSVEFYTLSWFHLIVPRGQDEVIEGTFITLILLFLNIM